MGRGRQRSVHQSGPVLGSMLTAVFHTVYTRHRLVIGSEPGIRFLGRGEIAGNLADESGRGGTHLPVGSPAICIPNTRLGELGS